MFLQIIKILFINQTTTTKKVYQSLINTPSLNLYTSETNNGIQMNQFPAIIYSKGSFVDDSQQPLIQSQQQFIEFSFIQSSPSGIHEQLQQLMNPEFLKIIYPRLDEAIKPTKITSRCLFSGHPDNPFYLFGCENGILYAFPLQYSPKQPPYTIYSTRIDYGSECSVVFLKIQGQFLFACSKKGRIVTFNLNEFSQEPLVVPKLTSSMQFKEQKLESDNKPKNRNTLFNADDKWRDLNIINLNFKSENMLPCKMINSLKIKSLEMDVTGDDPQQQHEEDQHHHQQQQIQDPQTSTEYTAFQLQNNVIVVYILATGQTLCQLNGINDECKIYGIYLETRSLHWLVSTSEGYLYTYDITGKFERLLKVSDHYSLLRIQERLHAKQIVSKDYHRLSQFVVDESKNISQVHQLLEYAIRNYFIPMNQPMPVAYETAGPLQLIEFEPVQAHLLMWLLDFQSAWAQTQFSGQQLTRVIQLPKIGDIEWWDVRAQFPALQEAHNLRSRLVSTLFPWGADIGLDAQLDSLIGGMRQVFKVNLGLQSSGYAFSFISQSRWATSEYLTSIQAMIIMHYYIGLSFRDNNLMTSLMFQTVELFTKKSQQVDPKFQQLDLLHVARYTIDEQNEIMTAACNLIISQVINRDQNMEQKLQTIKRLLEIQFNDPNINAQFSYTEVICLVIKSYCDIFSEKGEVYKQAAERVIAGVNLQTALVNPYLAATLLKQLIDGLQHFKAFVNPSQILKKLFFIFFNYNTAIEYLGTLRDNPQLGKKGFQIIEELSHQSEETKQRMKQLAVKAIIHVGNLSLQDFYALIRKDILNMELHMLYPCSIIDLIRNYIKSSNQHAIKHLPFLIEIILKSLDPNNPNLRKVCHKAATKALQTICKMFQCVAFHQATQKIALGSSDNQIIIYDLRTAVKWRVLDGHEAQVTALGFDNEGKQLGSFSYVDGTLRVWKVGSTGFFGSILGIQGKHQKLFKIARNQMDVNTKVCVSFTENDNSIILRIGDKSTNYKIN